MPHYERELEIALEIAESAGRFTLEHFGSELEVERKADASPVTIADRGAEQMIRKGFYINLAGIVIIAAVGYWIAPLVL